MHTDRFNIHKLYFLPTCLLTQYITVIFEKLTGLQLVKKFSALYGIRRFIAAFTSARHLSLSWASSIQSTTPHPTYWRSILICQDGARPAFFQNCCVVLCIVYFYCSMYCLCVNVYCHRVTIQLQLTNISYHIILPSKSWVSKVVSFPQVFPPKPYIRLPSPHTRYMTRPSHSSRFYHPHNIGQWVQITKLLIM